jgi:hypothetical protein
MEEKLEQMEESLIKSSERKRYLERVKNNLVFHSSLAHHPDQKDHSCYLVN